MVAAQSQLEGITVFQVKGDGTLDQGDGRGGRKWVEISSVRKVTLLAKQMRGTGGEDPERAQKKNIVKPGCWET